MSAYIGTRAAANWTGQIGSGGVADDTVTTVPLQSATGLTNGKVYIATLNRVDSNGTATPSAKEVVKGTLSGSNLINCTRGVEGTAQSHNAGAVVEILFTATHHNELVEGLEVEHGSDGTHDFSSSNVDFQGISLGAGTTMTSIKDEDDMASDSATSLATQQSIKAYVDSSGGVDGWKDATGETWVYVSAASFKIEGVDLTAQYTKGTRIKCTNSTVKYFVVTSSSFSTDTTVNVTGGTDYALADADITSPYYSYQASPMGYPAYFGYTPSYTPDGSMTFSSVTVNYCKFAVTDRTCHYFVRVTGTIGGTPSAQVDVSLPISAANSNALCTNGDCDSVSGTVRDSGATSTCRCKRTDGASWTAGSRYIRFSLVYEI